MKGDLQIKLVKKYPNLYKNFGGDVRQTLMAFGFECGDGWFKLIDELSAKLEPLGIVAEQVKEKWGGLRFYIGLGSDEAFDLIEKAEKESYKICELCGNEGNPKGKGWIKTLCDECTKKGE